MDTFQSTLDLFNYSNLTENPKTSGVNIQDHVSTLMRLLIKEARTVLYLISTSGFSERYACFENNEPDVYTFTSSTTSKSLKFECFARVNEDQVQKLRTYEFTSHPFFEETISQFTKTKDKPNQVLMRARPWDVGYNMIMKVEFLDKEEQKDPTNILLSREYKILKHMWGFFVKEGWDMEEMLGIPMVFDFQAVPNDLYNFTDVHLCKEIDIYGNLIPLRADPKALRSSSLSYLTIEKLGPNIGYLMQLYGCANSTSPVFTFETAFKIFDQIICRLIQIHRSGVIHYDICPENVYFGRAQGVNLVYLSNYKSAVCIDTSTEKARMSKFIGNERFGSLTALKFVTIHPFQDLESAFYLLMAMLNVSLPWDMGLHPIRLQYFKNHQPKNLGFLHTSSNAYDVDDTSNNSTTNLKKIAALKESLKVPEHDQHAILKMRDAKATFWKSPQLMKKFIQNLDFEHKEESFHKELASEILYELYIKIRDLTQKYSGNKQQAHFYKNLKFATSNELNIYSDIRRCVLIYFRFDKHSDLLAGLTYQNKEEMIRGEKDSRAAWDLSSWCFSNIEIYLGTSSSMKRSFRGNIGLDGSKRA